MGVLEVILNLVDNMTPGLEAANTAVNSLEFSVENAGAAIDNIDPGQLNNVQDAAAEAGLDMQQVGEAASMAGVDISTIDSTPIKETSNAAKDGSQAAEEMASGFDLVGGALEALVGIKIVEYLSSAADAAGDFISRWDRMGIVFDENGASLSDLQAEYGSSINQMKSDTGRGLGDIQNSLINLGIAGVDNKDVLVQSFDAINAAAFIKNGGKNLDTISGAFTRMVQTGTLGTRQLAALGISTEGVFKATGMSLDELKKKFPEMSAEARAALLSTIIMASGGEEANEKWKNSWERLKYSVGTAFGYIERIIGSFILPVLIPAVELAVNVLNAFANGLDNLPSSIKAILGPFILFGGALASGYMVISGVTKVLSGLAPILGVLGIEVGSVGGIFGTMAGILSGPVGWAILAIVAAVVAAIAIWQTWSKEIIAFKDAIMSGDWGSAASMIVNSFNYVGSAIYDSLVYAGQQIWVFFANLPSWIGTNLTSWITMGRDIMAWVVQGLLSLSNYLTVVFTQMLNAMADEGGAEEAGTQAGESTGKGIIDGIKQWLLDNAPLIYQTLTLLFNQLMPLIGQLILQLGAIAALWMYQSAIQIGQQFLNGIMQFIWQLPGYVLMGLVQTLLTISTWGYQVWSFALWAGSMLLQGFIQFVSQLPGMAWSYLLAFLNYLGQLPGIAYGYAASTGSSIVSAIGSYLSSLPGRMYQWGMNALNRFVNGIIDAIPGLRGALSMVQSLFPASPPKEGPLSEIKDSNMESWMRGIMEAGSGVWDDFTINKNVLTGDSGKSTSGSGGKLEVIHVHDFKNVPKNLTKEELLAALRGITYNSDWLSLLDKTLSKSKVVTKTNLGA